MDGNRIPSAKTVGLMAIGYTAEIPGASSVSLPGGGYGLNVTVHIYLAKSSLNGSLGEHSRGGRARSSESSQPTHRSFWR